VNRRALLEGAVGVVAGMAVLGGACAAPAPHQAQDPHLVSPTPHQARDEQPVAAPLPYQAKDQHLGVASCASSLCHGSVTVNGHYDVLMNEYVTWSHQDAHARAYQALTGARGRAIAAKLGIGPAESAKECLDCHADNVPAARRGRRFALSDGVGCEACHGGAERWIGSHSTAKAGYADDVAHGLYPSADLAARAVLCESCHVGNADKRATHRIMGAGHPRLGFELDTFLALEPVHYTVDANYRRRKPAYGHGQTWAVGMLQASALQLDALQGTQLRGNGLFPELALFNCAACHDSSTQRLEWRRRTMTQSTAPGTVPLNDAYWRMSWLVARALDAREGAEVAAQAAAVQHAVMVSSEEVARQARQLASVLRRVQQRVADRTWSAAQASGVLDSVLGAGLDGEFRDYLGAEQAAMAVELLLIDSGRASLVKPEVDALYRTVQDVDAYRSAGFIAALSGLRAALPPAAH
jgi:hypothetical protein